MKNRLISIALIASMMLMLLSSCGKGNQSMFSQGELLNMICDAFGMYEYTQKSPYYANISSDSPYFDAVQSCVEWEIIDKDTKDFDITKRVTRGELASMLSRAIDPEFATRPEADRIAFAIENKLVEIAVDGKIREKIKVTRDEAEDAVNRAAAVWASREFSERVEEITYNSDVVDFSSDEASRSEAAILVSTDSEMPSTGGVVVYRRGDSLYSARVGGVTPADDGNTIVVVEGETKLPNDVGEDDIAEDIVVVSDDDLLDRESSIWLPKANGVIRDGDVFVYRKSDGLYVAKAEKVEESGEYYVIKESDEDFEFEDIAQDLFVQETVIPNLANATFIDGAGNVYPASGSSAGNLSASHGMINQMGLVSYGEVLSANGLLTDQRAALAKTALPNGEYKFKVNDVELSLKTGDNSIEVGFKLPTEQDSKGNMLKGFSGSVEVSDVRITNDVDYSVFGGLKHLTTKTDYKVKVSGSASEVWVDKIRAPYNNGNGAFLTNLLRSECRSISDPGASQISGHVKSPAITVGSWTIVEAGLVDVKIVLKLEFKVTGEVSATLTLQGAKGIEYRNGNVRVIKENSVDKDVSFKAKATALAKLGCEVELLHKWELIEAAVAGGVGLEASATVHMFDAERHLIETYDGDDLSSVALEEATTIEISSSPLALVNAAAAQGVAHIKVPDGDVILKNEVCYDVTAYVILKVEITPFSFISKVWGGAEYEILGKDNATFARAHVEDGNWQIGVGFANAANVECTKKYTPFEYIEDENDDVGASNTDQLDLKTYILVMQPGETRNLELEDRFKDASVNWVSDNTSVATVDSQGKVTAIETGTAIITASLSSDSNVSVKCAVYVDSYTNSNWEFLPADDNKVDIAENETEDVDNRV